MIYSLAFKKNNGIVTIKPVEKLDFLAVEQPRSQGIDQRDGKRRDLGTRSRSREGPEIRSPS